MTAADATAPEDDVVATGAPAAPAADALTAAAPGAAAPDPAAGVAAPDPAAGSAAPGPAAGVAAPGPAAGVAAPDPAADGPAADAGSPRRVSRPLVLAAGLFLTAAILAVALPRGSAPRAPAPAAATPREQAAVLPATPGTAMRVGAPLPLAHHRDETQWAAVRSDVTARARPSLHARAVGVLRARTPENTTNIVLPIARKRLWIRVRLPSLPNGTKGWVPRSALGAYGTVRTRLVVDLSARRLTLRRDGRRLLRVPVAIGRPGARTPTGHFVVRNILTRFKSAFYGPIALGTSARSETLTDWPGGGYVGIHGTNRPDLIGRAVSHGCIRLRNADVARLARELPIGTPLTIKR